MNKTLVALMALASAGCDLVNAPAKAETAPEVVRVPVAMIEVHKDHEESLSERIAQYQPDTLHVIRREGYEVAITSEMIPRINEYKRIHGAELQDNVLYFLSLAPEFCDPAFRQNDVECYCPEAWTIERNEATEPTRGERFSKQQINNAGGVWRTPSDSEVPPQMTLRAGQRTYTFPGAEVVCYDTGDCVLLGDLPER